MMSPTEYVFLALPPTRRSALLLPGASFARNEEVRNFVIPAALVREVHVVSCCCEPFESRRTHSGERVLEVGCRQRPLGAVRERFVDHLVDSTLDQCGKVGTAEQWRSLRDPFRVDVGGRAVLELELEDPRARFRIWRRHEEHSIESARPFHC